MLLEAVKETEHANERWLLGRKRRQAEKDEKESSSNARMAAAAAATSEKVIEKFVSRRGYLNSVTFPSMDHIPPILRNNNNNNNPDSSSSTKSTPNSTDSAALCAISGKVARYRDPLTGRGYHDLDAFRELRRRHAMDAAANIELMGNEKMDSIVVAPPDDAQKHPTNGSVSMRKPSLTKNGASNESALVLNGSVNPKKRSAKATLQRPKQTKQRIVQGPKKARSKSNGMPSTPGTVIAIIESNSAVSQGYHDSINITANKTTATDETIASSIQPVVLEATSAMDDTATLKDVSSFPPVLSTGKTDTQSSGISAVEAVASASGSNPVRNRVEELEVMVRLGSPSTPSSSDVRHSEQPAVVLSPGRRSGRKRSLSFKALENGLASGHSSCSNSSFVGTSTIAETPAISMAAESTDGSVSQNEDTGRDG